MPILRGVQVERHLTCVVAFTNVTPQGQTVVCTDRITLPRYCNSHRYDGIRTFTSDGLIPPSASTVRHKGENLYSPIRLNRRDNAMLSVTTGVRTVISDGLLRQNSSTVRHKDGFLQWREQKTATPHIHSECEQANLKS